MLNQLARRDATVSYKTKEHFESLATESLIEGRRITEVVSRTFCKAAEAGGHGMRAMSQSPDPLARMHTMTKRQGKSGTIDVKAVLAEDEEFLRALMRTALQEVLEAEMTEAVGAEKGERTAGRQGYRSGYYGRTLITRVGKLELRVPQDRMGRFSTELFERYQRSERALVAALAEMYVQGVSTRKVKAITEELCGHSFSASSISAMNQRLDDTLAHFAGRPLAEPFPI
jgi:transposase-like protein